MSTMVGDSDDTPQCGEVHKYTADSHPIAVAVAGSDDLTKPLLSTQCLASRCPISGQGGGEQCPVSIMDFELPANGFKAHPGGQYHLEKAKASDVPGLMFLAYHIGLDLDVKIASVAKALGVRMPERGPFFDDVHKLVQQVKVQHAKQHHIFIAWCLIITLALLVLFVWQIVAPRLEVAVGVALVFEVYFLNIFHTRNHKGGKLYGIPWLDAGLNPFYDFVENTFGYHVDTWRKNHNVLHHMHTNDAECDPDVPASYPAIRIFEKQERKPFHVLQTLYFLIYLPISTSRFPFENVFFHGGSKRFFLIWFVLMWVVPCFHGKVGIHATLTAQALSGVMLTYKFAVSHSHPDLPLHSGDDDAELYERAHDSVDAWMANQVEESISYGGYWFTLIFGGINMQIEHHLAPALDPPLLWFMSDGLKQLCKKYSIRYIEERSLLHAICRYHQRLWTLGQEARKDARIH